MRAQRGEEDAATQPSDEKDHRVLCLQREADDDADGNPPSLITGPSEASDEVRQQDEPEIVERHVLKKGTCSDRDRRDGRRRRRYQNGPAMAAEVARYQAGYDQGNALRHGRKKPETSQ